MAPIRLAVVADIHHGRDTFTKRGSAALPLLDRFVETVNDGGFDAVLDLGDRISDETAERDLVLQEAVAERFLRLRVPRHHLSGNHDLALLPPEENAAVLDAPVESRSVELGDLRIVLWQPDVALTRDRGLHLAAGDIDCLERLLGSDDRPTLLVSHVPLSGHTQTGNYYFERNPGHATYAELPEIRRVIANAPCPVTALAGHVHWNSLATVDGTPHITMQSLTETFTTGDPAGTTGVIEIEGDTFRWRASGLDPFAVALPWSRAKRRWTPPLPPFETGLIDPILGQPRVPEPV